MLSFRDRQGFRASPEMAGRSFGRELVESNLERQNCRVIPRKEYRCQNCGGVPGRSGDPCRCFPGLWGRPPEGEADIERWAAGRHRILSRMTIEQLNKECER